MDDNQPLGPPDSSTLPPPTNYPPGFRRARAGTLPSNVQLAAQRYASTLTHSTPTLEITPAMNTNISTNHPSQQQQQLPPTTRPSLRHASTAAAAISGERNSRLRSGSLSTLPPPGLNTNNSAFGSSLFSSSWLNSQGSYPVLDELRSITSNESVPGDEVHTLDYLGLDDRSRGPPPATVSELRNQAQAAIAGRLRATTVSNPYRNRPPLQALASSHQEEDMEGDDYDSQGHYRTRVDSFGDNGSYYNANSAYIAKGFKSSQHLTVSSRPRATSVGTLEDPSRVHRQVNYNDMNSGLLPQTGGAISGSSILRSLAEGKIQPQPQRLGAQAGVRFSGVDNVPQATANRSPVPGGYLQPPQSQGQPRSLSPNRETPQIQTPSRSLWIGNLDTTATKETLLTVFSPYGAIESLRLLPEKECGFVNFLDMNDAIRAKDDVLNRLGGNIGLANGQPVRIGYGKADSAPAQPAKTNTASPTLTGTGNNNISPNIGGMEVQSTPTRALWIGSIPSSTTPSTILSIFAPFGPIESARVLTHKNCGFSTRQVLSSCILQI